MRKKTIALALSVLILISFALPVLAQTRTFRDVPSTHFAFEAINWVSNPENGAFMVGDAGNNFHPGRHINKFEAAQIYAMAAGFRHVTHGLPEAERALHARSFEQNRPFLNDMAAEFASWNRTVDREIAFLLYRGILTQDDVRGFVTRTETAEERPFLTRQQAVAWMVRLIGEGDAAQEISLPPAVPFRDDAQIAHIYRRYVYHARELGIIQGADGFMSPAAHLTRAQMAAVFFNALAGELHETGEARTISGTIANVHLDTHVGIESDGSTEVFPVARNAVIMLDNVQRSVSLLDEGMAVAAIVDGQGNIVSLAARSIEPRERIIRGIVADFIPPEYPGGVPLITIDTPEGESYELRVLPASQFARNDAPVVDWSELRIGDAITAETYTDTITRAAAAGGLSSAQGRLTEIRITERIAEITLELEDGSASYFIRHEIFDVYTLRVGMHLYVNLYSREVLDITFI